MKSNKFNKKGRSTEERENPDFVKPKKKLNPEIKKFNPKSKRFLDEMYDDDQELDMTWN